MVQSINHSQPQLCSRVTCGALTSGHSPTSDILIELSLVGIHYFKAPHLILLCSQASVMTDINITL